ncbi:MAG: tRNA epoxyqueuosine(34) reductase QueG [Gammaproteobacteria bacterium]
MQAPPARLRTVTAKTPHTITEQKKLVAEIKQWGRELGFQQVGIAGVTLDEDERRLMEWLQAGWHGDMSYMARHGTKRSRPPELEPGTLSVISVRMDYLPEPLAESIRVLESPKLGFVSRYALGRDYHKLMRRRLQQLARRIEARIGTFGYRVFVDSAPVLEKPLAREAGLGWLGKHTNLVHPRAGSYFFLGEIYTDLPLPAETEQIGDHCGTCKRCIDACPTGAIVAPYKLDARSCISYLTIEHAGAIPEALRPRIGNRIYGCDDCQLVCPWNRFARLTQQPAFLAVRGLDQPRLIDLFSLREGEFLKQFEGSPIRRIGHERWLRNLAVALGNAPKSDAVSAALERRMEHPSQMVREHVQWALRRQRSAQT